MVKGRGGAGSVAGPRASHTGVSFEEEQAEKKTASPTAAKAKKDAAGERAGGVRVMR